MPRTRRLAPGLVALLVAACTSTPAAPATPSPTARLTARPTPPAAAATPAPTPRSIYDESADPRDDIAVALNTAKSDGKRVLLDFGADWCPDCHVLAHYLETPEGQALIEEHFVLVSIDVGLWDRNLDVVEDYGNAIWGGIPALVVLEPDGTIAGKLAAGEVASASRMTQEQVLELVASLAR